MKVTGSATLNAPADKVWQAILDPNVLVSTIPGCERLEETGENQFAATVTAGVASIRGTYDGKVQLSDLKPHDSLLLRAEGASAAGTVAVDVNVNFSDLGDGTTRIDYDADAVVGGMIGGVGQRMLTSVSKRISNEFFGNVNKVLNGEIVVGAAPVAVVQALDDGRQRLGGEFCGGRRHHLHPVRVYGDGRGRHPYRVGRPCGRGHLDLRFGRPGPQ